MNKSRLIFAVLLMVIASCVVLTAFKNTPQIVEPVSFGINAEKVLIADKSGSIQVDLEIKPEDTYPPDIDFKSSDENIATATLGAIDEKGNVLTASELKSKKDKLEKEDKEAADKIIVPTDTAIITAKSYGECEITGTLGKFSSSVNVIVADKQVSLTFDDGACSETQILLNGLRKENAKVTFFIVGEMTKRQDSHMMALSQAIKDGHEIGNHTYNHKASARTLKKELKKADKVITELGGDKTILMRPPGGSINKTTRACGKSIIMWSLDTMDWKYRDANTVCKRILDAKDGDIVLLHDLHKTSVKGALKAIPKLRKRGFYLVTVTELLGKTKPNKEYKMGKKGKLKTRILK